MSNPTVSVIIPVYNAQEGIKQCLDSLLNQSFTDFGALEPSDLPLQPVDLLAEPVDLLKLCQQYLGLREGAGVGGVDHLPHLPQGLSLIHI